MSTINTRWLNSTVIDLARTIYATGNFVHAGTVCPILADALMDAGCDNKKITDTLRMRVSQQASRRIVRDILIASGEKIARNINEAREMLASGMSNFVLDMGDRRNSNVIGTVVVRQAYGLEDGRMETVVLDRNGRLVAKIF